MRTFIIRARKGSTDSEKIKDQVGTKAHLEIIAHCVMNAFFVADGFREDVECYIVLDSAQDFPKTIKFSGAKGLSFDGFHEKAILSVLAMALKNSQYLAINEECTLAPGVAVLGFGFDKLLSHFITTNPIYLLAPKGEDLRSATIEDNPVFVLSDHLAMPKNNIKSLKNKGAKTISLGKKMLFASQCVVLINHELDRA